MNGDDFLARPAEMAALADALVRRRERAVVLQGTAGMGKTALASRFAHEFSGSFDAGVTMTSGALFQSGDMRHWADAAPTSGRHLHIFDGLDEAGTAPEPLLGALLDVVAANPQAQLLVTTRPGAAGRPLPHVELAPLDREQTSMLLRRISLRLDAPPDEIVELTGGNPRFANLLGRYALERGGYGAAGSVLTPFHQTGLVAPDGSPLAQQGEAARRIVTGVREVNDELIAMLQRQPDRVFEVDPRRFEEVTARLFERLGYEVSLTPAGGDGGKDLFIARTDELGSFLYYVECKRYAPRRPVGVALVRQLAGVLATDRATAAILLTTSRFTGPARETADQWRHRMSLKDYGDFKALLEAAGRRG